MTGAGAGLWRLIAAQAYGRIGNPAEGLGLLARQREVIEQTGLRVIEAETYRTEAQLTLMNGGADAQVEAENSLHKAIDVARRQQAKLYELRATVALARLFERTSRRDEARTMLAEIYGWFTEGFDLPDLKEAKALLEAPEIVKPPAQLIPPNPEIQTVDSMLESPSTAMNGALFS